MTEAISAGSPAPSDLAPDAGTPAARGEVSVAVVVTRVKGADPGATLASVRGQDRKPVSVALVGEPTPNDPEGVVVHESFEEVVTALSAEIDYVWILHGDAEPRPDALSALVTEAERHEASMVGSKLLVAGTRDTLEGVGSATDIFGEPYTGLDEGEVDLEQYDVVRDVAFVSSVSALVRRDLLRGLRGLDPELGPVAAGLDLSQRVRIAGGRVMVAPSSEVFHRQRCGRGDGGWREQSGRLRAMLKAYTPITLIWMVPFAFVAGLLDSLGSLILGRWRLGPRYLATWAWNLVHLPSTVMARRNLSRVRQVGDEELFRYQVGGSVRLRQVGSELSDRVLGVFDDERAVSKRANEVWNSAGAWGAAAALILVLVGVRSVFLGPLPAVGFSLPLADDGGTALARFLGGWNPAGTGTDSPVHPTVGLMAIIQSVLLDRPELARSLVTVGAFLGAVMGVSRLARRLGVGGPGSYVGGVAAAFGPAAAVLAADGRWSALLAIGVLPWALASVVGLRAEDRMGRLANVAVTTLWTGVMSLLVPVLFVVPLMFVIALKLVGRFPVRFLPAVVGVFGVLPTLPYLLARAATLVDGAALAVALPPLVALFILAASVAGMLSGSWRASAVGGAMTFAGFGMAALVGAELQQGLLVVAAVGVGLTASAGLRPRQPRNFAYWPSVVTALALIVVSIAGIGVPGVGVGGGRAGLPADQWGDSVAFVGLDPRGIERALLIAAEPRDLPGESRPGPGFWYRIIDSEGATLDQAALGPAGPGDAKLRAALGDIVSGESLRPGSLLAEFGIRWLVAVDEVAADLGPVLDAQVDLQPLALADNLAVYDNTVVESVAQPVDGDPWGRVGTGFGGQPTEGRVRLAVQGDSQWGPDWQADDWAGTVSGQQGAARFAGVTATLAMTLGGLILLALAAVVALWCVLRARRNEQGSLR